MRKKKKKVRAKSCPCELRSRLLSPACTRFKTRPKFSGQMYRYHFVMSVKGMTIRSSEIIIMRFDTFHFEERVRDTYLYEYKQIIRHILLMLYKKYPMTHDQIEQVPLYYNIRQFLEGIMRMKDVQGTPIELALEATNNLQVFLLSVCGDGSPQFVDAPNVYGHFSRYGSF